MLDAGAMRLHSDGIDAGIRPAASGHFFQSLENVHALVVDGLCTAVIGGFSKPRYDPIDCDDSLSPQHEGALHGKQTYRPAPPNGGHIPGGQNVGQEEDLLVMEILVDLYGSDVGERYSNELGLPPRISSIHVR